MSDSDSDITFRHLSSRDDYQACLELQRETWGQDFRELVPATLLAISQKVSGIAAGAFRGERMLGFVYGLTGPRKGRPSHWSHMLAVTREARGLGLGKKLKLFQRDALLELGVEVVYWTYDPLVARNANLNINGLGARPVEYVCDMYGDDTGSDLHSSLGTDRFVAQWEIASPGVAAALAGEAQRASVPPHAELLVNSDWASGALPREHGGTVNESLFDDGTDRYWVEVPENIEKTKHVDRDQALAWRASTRAALLAGLDNGFEVDGFAIGDPTGGEARRCFYRLARGG